MDIQKVASTGTAVAVIGGGSIFGGNFAIDQATGGPEKRTRDLEEKELGIDATNWLKEKLDSTIAGDDELTIRTELVGGVGKYGRLLGWLYIGDSDLSLNEQMITEGYAWEYDGGTKQKNFEELREIRRSFGTLEES